MLRSVGGLILKAAASLKAESSRGFYEFSTARIDILRLPKLLAQY